MRLSDRAVRIMAWASVATSLVLAASLAASWIFFSRLALDAAPPEPPPVELHPDPGPVSPLLVQYNLQLPGRGEIFPALAAAGSADYWPVALLSIANASEQAVLQRISAQVPGWSRRQETTVVLGPNEARTLRLEPEMLPRAFQNQSIRQATLEVRVADADAGAVFAQSRPVLLHSGAALYWGKRFANAQFVSRWVTPHDPAVLQLVSDARKHAPGGRLGGYNMANPTAQRLAAQTRTQAQAIFRALQQTQLSYVSSIFVFGNHINEAQRIRLPRETLTLKNANCMDVSVAFASAMENLGLRPVIVIIPGHAFTGVRLGPQAEDILYLDLTVLPKGSFQQAANRAQNWLQKAAPEEVITVDVSAARALGIYPIPD